MTNSSTSNSAIDSQAQPLVRATCHKARMSKDARFDGQFFTAVITTGIFCRPICPAKPPNEENVRYLKTAVEALEQGFAPCKRCFPELAPEQRLQNHQHSLFQALANAQGQIQLAAAHHNLSERQYRRQFISAFGVGPNQYWQKHRVLTALKLLRSSNLSITQICYISGFNSVRRFNEVIKQTYHQPPKQLKINQTSALNTIEIELSYRPPFDWQLMLSFFKLRALPSVEQITEQYYARVFDLNEARGWFKVSQIAGQDKLLLEISADQQTLLKPLTVPDIIRRVRVMFDLDADMRHIHSTLGQTPLLAKVIKQVPGLRLPGSWDIFEFSVRAILGQQVSVKAATSLAERIAQRYGQTAPENPFGLTHLFPTISELLINEKLTEVQEPSVQKRPSSVKSLSSTNKSCSVVDFSNIGLTQTRIATLQTWCRFYQDNQQLLSQTTPLSELNEKLSALKGIGPWTINYIAMRGLSYPDAFPSADLGVIKALTIKGKKPTNKAILSQAQAWQPWRAYATLYLWQSLL